MTCAVMPIRRDDAEWRERKLHDWLFALVRFAVSLEEADRRAVLSMAGDLDVLGSVRGRTTFSYFVRTSTLVCRAIADPAYSGRDAILRRFVDAIGKRRLREVFVTALSLDAAPQPHGGLAAAIEPCRGIGVP
jgi:hypothetical protein